MNIFKYKISVIIPVYNAERFLSECIESVINQQFDSFEVILIDDGSTDNSAVICDDYASRLSSVKVVHQINGGVTSARKKGVEIAGGEWISFVDADDTLPLTALMDLWDKTTGKSTDIVIGFLNEPEKEGVESIPIEKWREYCISGEFILPGPWGRLFRKSLFDDFILDIPREIVKGEDMLMNIRLAFRSIVSPVIVYKKVYNYRKNEESVLHTFIQDAKYEMALHYYRLLSIPEQYQRYYLPASIHKRVLSFNEIYTHDPYDVTWIGSPAYTLLLNDMKNAKVYLSPKMWLKFHGTNPLWRKLVWIIVRCDDWVYGYKCKIKVFIKSLVS